MTTLQDLLLDRLTPRQRLAHKLRDGKYRAHKMGNYVEHVSIDAAAFMLDIHRCYYCNRELHDHLVAGYTLEHKEPLKLGGPHTLDNLCKACPACNQEKHIQTELEYIARLDFMS